MTEIPNQEELESIAWSAFTSVEKQALTSSININFKPKSPFSKITSGLLAFSLNKARRGILKKWDNYFDALENDSLLQLEEKLVKIIGRVLLLEFRIYCVDQFSDFDREVQRHTQSKSFVLHDSFSNWVVNGGWRVMFERYGALPYLIGSTIYFWSSGVYEFLCRLTSDLPAIISFFSAERTIKRISPNHSDPHFGGRTVHIIEFAGGKRILYKSKSMNIAYAAQEFISSVERTTKLKSLRCPKTLNKGAYGWQQFISYSPSTSPKYARDYYKRCGRALAILHLINGEDIHHENIICHKGAPYLIDCEMLITPRGHKDEIDTLSDDPLYDSVLRTGMLPRWNLSPSGGFDVSTLGCMPSADNSVIRPCWTDEDFDSVSLVDEVALLGTAYNHRPSPNCPHASFYVEDIVRGFKEMCSAIIFSRKKIAQDLQLFRNSQCRVLFRTTREYELILRTATSPVNLLTLELFSKSLFEACGYSENPHTKSHQDNIIEREVKQLSSLDIPYFYAPTTSSKDIFEFGFSISGLDSVLSKINMLGNRGVVIQSQIIKGSLIASQTNFSSPLQCMTRTSYDRKEEKSVCVFGQHAMDAAISNIAITLERGSIELRDGSSTWLNLDRIESMSRYQLNQMNSFLYSGRIGVIIFLSSCPHTAHSYREESVKLTARAIARSIESKKLVDLQNGCSVSPFFGLPSIAYGLSLISENIKDYSLIESSLEIMRRLQNIDPNLEVLDFINGLAGFIRALHSLYDRVKQDWLIEFACKLADHLLISRRKTKHGNLSWPSPLSSKFLVGYAHGASGIAYSLAVLGELIGDDRYIHAAVDALRYEDKEIKACGGFIPDHRLGMANHTPRSIGFIDGWCAGTSGLALARQAIRDKAKMPAMKEYLDSWKEIVINSDLSEMDHLCCGNSGKLECYIKTDHLKAFKFSELFLARLNNAGPRVFGDLPAGIPNYSFFKGISGIGYSLNRINNHSLPSVLLLE